MFCRKCGKELNDEWAQCPYCGENVQDKNSKETRNRHIYKKWWFWVIVVILIVFPVIGLMQGDDSERQEQITTEEKKDVDFAKMDVKDLIETKEEDLEKFGFQKAKGTSDYSALNGDIQISCVDGKITSILLSGDLKKTPSFYGIRIGSEETGAYTKILEVYPEEKDGAEEKTFLNLDTKESVICKAEDGKITSIEYRILSDNEITVYITQKEEALRAEYIFPDSDKKYLSEDEVRSMTVDRLYIGRNEIFARYGYIFEDPNLKQHFEATSWYQGTVPGDQFNADATLNDFEKKNVELIKRIEDEINGPSEEELAKQAAVDGAYNAVAGRKFHLRDAQRTIEFTANGEFIYSISSFATDSCTYNFSSRYEMYRDGIYDYLVYVNIAGVEYYFRYFNNGSISLGGEGEFDGWYDPL